MSNSDLFSSKILSNKDILIDLYQTVKDVAYETVNNPEVIAQKRNVCLLPLDVAGVKRTQSSQKCIDSNEAEVLYNPEALTIIGGAALNLYDFELEDYKTRKQIPELRDFIKKSTADIDIVWWPTFHVLNPELEGKYVAISQSVAIQTVAKIFTILLNEKFSAINNSELMNEISAILGGETSVYVINKPTYPAGVWNIECNFVSNGKEYKLIEIALHDTAAGQRYDRFGYEINSLLPMEKDPVYSSLEPNPKVIIQKLQFGDKVVGVCNLISFTQQQLFAFTLLLKVRSTKALINYKRIIFIIHLLTNIQQTNTRNMEILHGLFGTETNKMREELLHLIKTDLLYLIKINNDELIQQLNIPGKDKILNELHIIVINNKIDTLRKQYDSKIFNAQGPIRKLKRTHMSRKSENAIKIHTNVNKKVSAIDEEFNIIKNGLQSSINKLKDNASSYLLETTYPTITIPPITPVLQKKNATEISTLPPLIPSPVISPPVIPPPLLTPISQYIPPPTTSTIYSPPSLLQKPQQAQASMQNVRYTGPSATTRGNIKILQRPPQQTRKNIYASSSMMPPPFTASIPRYASILNNPSIPKSRLLYNIVTRTFSVVDVLHNMMVEVDYDPIRKLYYSKEPTLNEWLPLYYDSINGVFYPVYYYPSTKVLAIFDDTTGQKIPLHLDKVTGAYKIYQKMQSVSYYGGKKTRRNKV